MRVGRRRLAFGEVSRRALELVLKVDVFSSLDRTQLLVLLRDGAFMETHPPGSEVVTLGEEGDSMYVVLDGELDVNLGDEPPPRGQRGGRERKRGRGRRPARQLTRGDIFGELCLLTGAPRSASVTATYQGATLLEINAAAMVPILASVREFIPTAAAVLAGRYLDRDPAWAAMEAAAREQRLAVRAGRLAESIYNFHNIRVADQGDGRVAARKLTGWSGLGGVGGGVEDHYPSDDPSPGVPGELGVGLLTNGDGGVHGIAAVAAARTRNNGSTTTNINTNSGGGSGGGGSDGKDAFVEAAAAGLHLHPFFSALTAAETRAVRRNFKPLTPCTTDPKPKQYLEPSTILNCKPEAVNREP
jgi:CRP-like cAMP-binding protein